MSNFASELNNLMPAVIKEEYQKASYKLLVFIRNRMGEKTGSQKFSQTANQPANALLRVVTGKLYRSFTVRNKENISNIEYENGRVKWEYGSALAYAQIHEKGGFIKATEATTKKRRKSKTRKASAGGKKTYLMASHFWKIFYKTGNKYYKNLALGVMKRGGVNIPARPYFNPAIEDFMTAKAGGNDSVIKAVIKQVKKLWDEFNGVTISDGTTTYTLKRG